MKRFVIVLFFATILRFFLAEHTISFVWFIVLYLPMINWGVYWTFCIIRIGVNKLYNKEKITLLGMRKVYTWYLFVPGCLVIAEVFYLGAKYNHLM